MNPSLKERHFEFITSENARDVYERLAAACEKRPGGCDDACLLLIADYCRNEQLKEMLLKDVQDRGLGREVKNYRQQYFKPNESVAHLRSVIEQQRKLLSELKLTPASNKAEQLSITDELSEF